LLDELDETLVNDVEGIGWLSLFEDDLTGPERFELNLLHQSGDLFPRAQPEQRNSVYECAHGAVNVSLHDQFVKAALSGDQFLDDELRHEEEECGSQCFGHGQMSVH